MHGGGGKGGLAGGMVVKGVGLPHSRLLTEVRVPDLPGGLSPLPPLPSPPLQIKNT